MPLVDDLRTLADDLREASADLAGGNPSLSASLAIDAAVVDQTADQVELQTYYVAQLETQDDLLDGVEADWFDTGWASRREITLDNAGGAAKTDHVVNVVLDTSNFPVFDNVLAGGADIRFTRSNGTTLISHWIESWDDDEQTASLWVKVPTIGADTTATIYMYYENSAALSSSSIENTFIAAIDFSDTSKLESTIGYDGQVYLWNRNGLADVNPIVDTDDIAVTSFREQDDIVFDPDDPNLEDHPERLYKFYFTGVDPQSRTWVAFSPDGIGWGDYEQTNITLGRQDPSIVTKLSATGEVYRDGSDLMYCYVEAALDVDVFSSTDGITWTLAGEDAIPRGTSGAWDDALTGSPVARHDGTNFIVGYEGIKAGSPQEDAFGTAVGTVAGTLTKNAANPLFSADDHPAMAGTAKDSVICDAFWLNDARDRVIFVGHTTSSTRSLWRAYSEELDPTAWDDTSILPLTETLVDQGIRNDITRDNASGGRRIITTSTDDTQVLFYNVSSADADWSVVRDIVADTSGNVNAELSDIDIVDGQLVLQPWDPTAQNFNIGVYKTTSFGEASNFEIMVRAKQEAQTSDQWAFIAFGSGDYANPVESAAEVYHYGVITSGYLAHFAQPGSGSGLRLREVDADRVSTSLATAALAAADTQDFGVRKFSYTSGGVLKATVGGSTVATTDATFLAGDKTVLIGQGQRDTDIGATQTIDWVVVRPYDGVDPTVTIEEVSSLSSPAHDTMTGLTDDDHTQYVLESIVAAKGDLIVATADNTLGVLTVGANGTVLTCASGEATGLEWA
jgi:hypothetical protein